MDKLQQLIQEYQPNNEQEQKDRLQFLAALHEPNILTRANTRAHITSSNWIVNPQRTKVLMVFHNQYNSWSWTGGHNDGDANCLRVAKREALEETGLSTLTLLDPNIISLEILPVWGHQKRGSFVSSHLHYNVTYLWEAHEHQPLHHNPSENQAVAWIANTKLANYIREAEMLPIYDKLIQASKNVPPK
ncbi:MAG: NUDIX hydrolase [Erysipelotrichaceae bacterium]